MMSCNPHKLDQGSMSHAPNRDSLIVLFHGLGANASFLKILKDELTKTFPTASVVALNSVEEGKTGLLSIKEQGHASFKELKQRIPDLEHRPTLLIGHSQGGLRAYSMFDQYKDLLNIKGIVTLATPWEGAPILNANPALLLDYCTWPVAMDMQNFSISIGEDPDWLEEELISRLNNSMLLSAHIGCSDLKPESPFLNWVKQALPKETLPILAIGGGQSDFKTFLTQNSNYDFRYLNETWTKIIVGQGACTLQRHDMIVPLYSQLALHIIPEGEGHSNFQRFLIQDAVHDQLWPVPPNKKLNILCHAAMINEVISFGKDILTTTA